MAEYDLVDFKIKKEADIYYLTWYDTTTQNNEAYFLWRDEDTREEAQQYFADIEEDELYHYHETYEGVFEYIDDYVSRMCREDYDFEKLIEGKTYDETSYLDAMVELREYCQDVVQEEYDRFMRSKGEV